MKDTAPADDVTKYSAISDADRAALAANEIKRAQYEARWLAAQPKEAREVHLAGVLEKRGQDAHDALRAAAKQAYAEAVRNVVERRALALEASREVSLER